jgi:hypothetical protein
VTVEGSSLSVRDLGCSESIKPRAVSVARAGAAAGYDSRVLDGLMVISLMGVVTAVLLHLASFSMAGDSNALHVTLFMGALLLFAGAMFSFPRSQTEVHGTTITLKETIWEYVPWWLYSPAVAMGIYAAIGLAGC